jgi:hypothetical protein
VTDRSGNWQRQRDGQIRELAETERRTDQRTGRDPRWTDQGTGRDRERDRSGRELAETERRTDQGAGRDRKTGRSVNMQRPKNRHNRKKCRELWIE